MSAGLIVIVALALLAAVSLLWCGWSWLARSWEVLDDDQLSEKLARDGRSAHLPAVWLRARGWFGRGPRQLTYRRDERGRFRRMRR